MCVIGKEVREIKPLIAWRVFRQYDDMKFGSLYANKEQRYEWNVTAIADARPKMTERHTWFNEHGFWAFKTYNKASQQKAKASYMGVVIAKVELFGQIVEHEHGYRAEYMRIVKVYENAKS